MRPISRVICDEPDGNGYSRDVDDWEVYNQACNALAEGRPARAALYVLAVARAYPDNAMVQELLGRCYLTIGWRWRASQSFEAIVHQYPLDPYAHHCLGRAYEGMGEAFEHLTSRHYSLAVALDPANPGFVLRKQLFDYGRQLI